MNFSSRSSVRSLSLLTFAVMGGQAATPALAAIIFQDTQMISTGSGGVWEKFTGVIYGAGSSSFTFSTTGDGGGNPGSFLHAGIGGGVTNGGQGNVYFGPTLDGIGAFSELGSFDYAFDLRVISASALPPTFRVRPALLHNDGVSSSWTMLLYNGGSRVIAADSTTWETEAWSGLTASDFSEYDAFLINPVSGAAGRTGTFRASFFAEVRSTSGSGFLNWGIDNLTLATAAVVPEPASATLLAAGAVAGCVMFRRRPRRLS